MSIQEVKSTLKNSYILAGREVDMANNNNEIKKQKKRAFNFVKVAFLMFKNRSNDKPKPITKSTQPSNGNWKKFVGSMRPLHLQDDDRPLPPSPPFPSTSPFSEEIICSGASPTPSYLSGDTMSQYASATNLCELESDIIQFPHWR